MFDFLKRKQPYPPPETDRDTFLVWEPCSRNHAEVVPGFTKYLLDLGYRVSILITPERIDEGLFSRFGKNENVRLNRLPQKAIRALLLENGIGNAKGILITTMTGKIDTGKIPLAQGQKILRVSHDVKEDAAAIDEKTITLHRVDYNGLKTVIVNPHYFGDIAPAAKNSVVDFITVGALRGKRRNTAPLVRAVRKLVDANIRNFKITVVGKGGMRNLPREIKPYFNIRGRLDFSELYDHLGRADFYLPLLDPENPDHERYITTGTSGSFQLIYGFRKPPLIAAKFAPLRGLNRRNSLVYEDGSRLADAMATAICMTPREYAAMQKELDEYAQELYRESLANLAGSIG
ncbi:MAG: hypothetical protein QM330_00050 [Acidobacteriota bacterium]|nr:hypothetical protein [Acidobacteriota bacterium]